MGLINPGVGLVHSAASGGIAFEVLPPVTGAAEHPFFVSLFKSGSDWKFKVKPGTINGLVPSMSSSKLDAVPAPEKAIGSASGYVYVVCKYDDEEAFPLEADLTVEYDTALPANSDTLCHVPLAYIDFSGSAPRKTGQFVMTSLWGERLKCGDNDAEYFFCRA